MDKFCFKISSVDEENHGLTENDKIRLKTRKKSGSKHVDNTGDHFCSPNNLPEIFSKPHGNKLTNFKTTSTLTNMKYSNKNPISKECSALDCKEKCNTSNFNNVEKNNLIKFNNNRCSQLELENILENCFKEGIDFDTTFLNLKNQKILEEISIKEDNNTEQTTESKSSLKNELITIPKNPLVSCCSKGKHSKPSSSNFQNENISSKCSSSQSNKCSENTKSNDLKSTSSCNLSIVDSQIFYSVFDTTVKFLKANKSRSSHFVSPFQSPDSIFKDKGTFSKLNSLGYITSNNNNSHYMLNPQDSTGKNKET